MTEQHPSGLRPVLVSKRWWQSTGPEEQRGWNTEPIGFAWFHQFGSNFEEFEDGPGNYTTAVIEWPDGSVETVQPEAIKFLDVVKPVERKRFRVELHRSEYVPMPLTPWLDFSYDKQGGWIRLVARPEVVTLPTDLLVITNDDVWLSYPLLDRHQDRFYVGSVANLIGDDWDAVAQKGGAA